MSRIIQELRSPEPFKHAWDHNYWHKLGRWRQRPLPSSFWMGYGHSSSVHRLYPDHRFGAVFDVDGFFYLSNDDFEYLVRDLVKRDEDGTLESFVQLFDKVGNELSLRYRKIFTEEAPLSLRGAFELHAEMAGPWMFASIFGDIVTQAALRLNVASSETDLLQLALPHVRESWIEQEEKHSRSVAEELLKCGISSISTDTIDTMLDEYPSLKDLVNSYRETYRWLGINKWEGEHSTPERFCERINEAIENVRESNYVKSKKPLPDTPSVPIIQIAVCAAYWRPTFVSFAEELALVLRDRIEQVGKRHDLSYADCLLLTYPELIALDEGEKLRMSRKELNSREEGFVTYTDTDDLIRCEGRNQDVYRTMSSLYAQSEALDNSDTLTGTVASKGHARGAVKVVTQHGDFDKFEENDVLVAPETTPAYVPLMRKASAILTERGGITSHAAIVSRELGVPCIISVTGATSSLRDGDLVEVDADRGVVRILEKKEGDRNATVPSQQRIQVKDWQPSITRSISFWQQCLSSRGHFTFSESFGVDTPCRFLAITRNGTMTTLFSEQTNLKEYADAVMRAVGSLRKVRNLREKYESFADEFLLALYRCEADTSAESWEQFVYQNTRYSAGLFLTSIIGREGASRLTSILRDTNIDEFDVPRIMAVITYPNDWTPLLRSRLDLLEIGKQVQDDEPPKDRVEMLLQEWLENHGYIPVNYCEEPWTQEDARKQLDEVLESDCTAELDRLRKEQAEKQAEKRRILKEIDDETVSTLAYAIAEGTYLNEFRKNVFSRVSLGYRGIFSRVAEMAGSDNWRDCFFLTPEEMRDIISGKEVDIEAKKQERQVIGYIPNQDGSIHFLTEEETNAFSDFLDSLHGGKSEEKREVTEIPGFIASTGKVRGTVKVILSSKDFEKMETGDILVTAMTSVDFVPIMERAGAFVTNEGGVTSHAAIVSREMGKPCIIGTKIATQALHDGDLVEVDAEEGVVRVLKSE